MRSAEEFEAVRRLIATGLNDCAIARETGIPRRTVWEWRRRRSAGSEDIHGLFTATLDSLGIPWTRSTEYIVSIYRKAAVARLDEFAGPKAVAVPWNDVRYDAT